MIGKSNFRKPAGVAWLLIGGACACSGGACGPSAKYSRLSAADGSGDDTGSGGAGTDASGAGGVIGTGGVVGTGGTFGGGGAIGTGGELGTGGGAAGGGAVGGAGGVGAAGGGGAIGTGGVGMGGNGGRGGRGGRGGGGAGGVGTGGTMGGTGGANGDGSRYNFETGTQGWMGATDAGLTLFTTVATSAAQHFAGLSAFAGAVTMAAGGLSALVALPPLAPIPAGTNVTYHIFVPGGSLIDYVQPYVQEAGSFLFTGTTHVLTLAEFGNWITLIVVVPSNSVAIGTIGVEFHESGTAGSSTVYIDSISW